MPHLHKIVYPDASSLYYPNLIGNGEWPERAPLGVVIHTTRDLDLEHVRRMAILNGRGFHAIVDESGLVHPTAYFNEQVNHMKHGSWRRFPANKNFIALAILNAGVITDDESKNIQRRRVQDGQTFHAAPIAQEQALFDLIAWICDRFEVSPDLVCSFDECLSTSVPSNSLGGSVSFLMEDLRARLWNRF